MLELFMEATTKSSQENFEKLHVTVVGDLNPIWGGVGGGFCPPPMTFSTVAP